MDVPSQIEKWRKTITHAWQAHLAAIAGRALVPADIAVEAQIHKMEVMLARWEAVTGQPPV